MIQRFCKPIAKIADMLQEQLYFFGIDRTPFATGAGRKSHPVGVSTASRAGEVHLARAENLYMGYLDYDRACR